MSAKMNKAALLNELMQLSVEDRLDLVQDLWDSIPAENFPPLSEEQMAELDRRWLSMRRTVVSIAMGTGAPVAVVAL
jgi:putative addiction module component (TIGR02574 family)